MSYRPELFAALPLLASAIPIPRLSSPSHIRYARDVAECTHPGNPDFYGLGIRLGIYLQLACTILGMFDSQSYSLLFDFHASNAILLLAVFVALIKSTPSQEIETVDVIILLRLLWLIIICGFSLGHLTDEIRRMKRTRNFLEVITVPSALLFRCIVIAIICIYNVWFWYRGVEFFESAHPSDCNTYAFFFARLSASGGLRTLYKVASTVLMILPPVWVLAYLVFCVGAFYGAMALGVVLVVTLYVFVLPILLVVGAIIAFERSKGKRNDHGIQQRDTQSPRKKNRSVKSTKAKAQMQVAWLFEFTVVLLDTIASFWEKVRRRESVEEQTQRITEPPHPISKG
jgi:hypothetical protein